MIYFRQYIIGLRRYETEDLLIHLIYLTFLVVITAIQLLIFHEKYNRQFVWKKTETRNINEASTSDEQNINQNAETADMSYIEKVSAFWMSFALLLSKKRIESKRMKWIKTHGLLVSLVELQVIQSVTSIIDMNTKAFDWIFRFMELQLFKVILILGFVMSISEITAFNLLLNILVIVACTVENYTTQLSSGLISLVAGVNIILKMLYQLFKVPDVLADLFCFSVSWI